MITRKQNLPPRDEQNLVFPRGQSIYDKNVDVAELLLRHEYSREGIEKLISRINQSCNRFINRIENRSIYKKIRNASRLIFFLKFRDK